MKKSKFKIKNVKLAFIILIITAIVLLVLYYIFVFSSLAEKHNFSNQMVEIAEENEKPVFSIQRFIVYSNANAVDNSENQSLSDVSISQFSDILIYINNRQTSSDLTDENTVKELYIDNINLSTQKDLGTGTKILNYKKPTENGKYQDLEQAQNNRIDFNITRTNQENENNDYNSPTFYLDCSNPISLGYIYKDLLTNYSISDNSKVVSFNGKILEEAKINLEDITPTLKFTIHIVNNAGEKFAYNMDLKLDLNGIYNGYSFKSKTIGEDEAKEFQFFKEINNL